MIFYYMNDICYDTTRPIFIREVLMGVDVETDRKTLGKTWRTLQKKRRRVERARELQNTRRQPTESTKQG